MFMLDFQAARYLMDGDIAKQAGNNHPTTIPTGVFVTSDGYMNIAVAGELIWERFAAALGHKDWITNPDYATGPDRSKNRDTLNAAITSITVTKTPVGIEVGWLLPACLAISPSIRYRAA